MKTEPTKVYFSVPVRRTRWTSFWVGTAAVISALMLAFAFSGLLLSLVNIDGTVVIIAFGLIWFGLFFLSYPLQRRYARSLDLRRPGITLADGILAVPLPENSVLHFNLAAPHELIFGWREYSMVSTGPTSRTRSVWTHATLSQTGQQLNLIAEDSIRDAQSAGWPQTSGSSTPTMFHVRLWASDLVALVEAMRALTHPSRL